MFISKNKITISFNLSSYTKTIVIPVIIYSFSLSTRMTNNCIIRTKMLKADVKHSYENMFVGVF